MKQSFERDTQGESGLMTLTFSNDEKVIETGLSEGELLTISASDIKKLVSNSVEMGINTDLEIHIEHENGNFWLEGDGRPTIANGIFETLKDKDLEIDNMEHVLIEEFGFDLVIVNFERLKS